MAAIATVALAAVSLSITVASASIVRCTAPDGRITYQNSTCPNGARGVPVDETANRGFRFAELGSSSSLWRQTLSSESGRADVL